MGNAVLPLFEWVLVKEKNLSLISFRTDTDIVESLLKEDVQKDKNDPVVCFNSA